MRDGAFEWDDVKAEANVSKHGITFEAACSAFGDEHGYVQEADSMGEQRFKLVAMADNRLLVVIYTQRGEAIRIISARHAEPFERRRYHNENQT
jgi:uncharacterized protein